MARPIVFTKEIVKKLEEIFSLDGSVLEACFYAGITPQTYYNHVKEDAGINTPERKLFDRFSELRHNPVLKARRTVVKALDNPKDAQWYLERKRKKEFAEKQEHSVEVTSKIILADE